ncbi:hypothetical protein [Agarilytica rhodophyticola]|uniref:hypothetical protein n=1 Tax=Agarilytica rhodophyticola TaxID=1737490 RepID=UPI000B3425F2|nr:hypothetical protein [Agarilytica rhodophyticola]
MSKKIKYRDSCCAFYPKDGGRYSGDEKEEIDNWGSYKSSSLLIATRNGFVNASANMHLSRNGEKCENSFLTIIKDGKQYSRDFDKYYTPRGLVTKAKQFSKDVFNKV